MAITRTQWWALYALLAALICAVGFGQAFDREVNIAAVVLFVDWLVAVLALVYLRYVERTVDREVHP